MKTTILFLLSLLLAGCAMPGLTPDAYANASMACLTGATWNGSPASVLYVGVDKGVSGTKGGLVSLKCGAAEAGFTDNGNLTPAGQSIRVPVTATPMKLTPQ